MNSMQRVAKSIPVNVQFEGKFCGRTAGKNAKVCHYFIHLNDPVAGPQYCGICGLFRTYLKFDCEDIFQMPIRRCYKCKQTF